MPTIHMLELADAITSREAGDTTSHWSNRTGECCMSGGEWKTGLMISGKLVFRRELIRADVGISRVEATLRLIGTVDDPSDEDLQLSMEFLTEQCV